MERKNAFWVVAGLVLAVAVSLILSCSGGGGGAGGNGTPTFTLSGNVTGNVLQGVTITVTGTGFGTISTTSGTGGAYSVSGLSNGYYTVTASMPNYAFSPPSEVVVINNANQAAADFVSVHAWTLAGVVSDATTSAPVAGATMTLTGAALTSALTATTDSTGMYSFSGLVTDGTYTLTPGKSIQLCICNPPICSMHAYTFTPANLVIPVSGADVLNQGFSGTAPTIGPHACPT